MYVCSYFCDLDLDLDLHGEDLDLDFNFEDLTTSLAGTLYIHFWRFSPRNEILPGAVLQYSLCV